MGDRICSIPECARQHYAKNLCKMHYARLRKTGSTVLAARKDQLLANVRVTETCWIWTGKPTSNGYGRFGLDGNMIAAHRASYLLFVGPIPEGLELDHRCHTDDTECPGGSSCPHRRCVNPEHLEPTTHLENVQRGRGGQLQLARTHCPQGHPYDADNTFMRADGARGCRICRNDRSRKCKARKRAQTAPR